MTQESRAARISYRALALTLLLAVSAVGLVGCAGRTPVKAPPLVENPLPELLDKPYRLQAGDLVHIRFWGLDELDEEQTIRPDGVLSLPYLDEVKAAGLTPKELDDLLTELYAAELARPNLTVIVREPVIPRVYISGEVTQQKVMELRPNMTLMQAIQAAGGFLPTARRKEIVLIRRGDDGKPLARSVNLLPVLSGEDPASDPRLANADVVFVPRTKIANVNLFVDQYIDDLIPLQSVFSGALLADITRQSNNADSTTTTPDPQPTSDSGDNGGNP